MMVISIKYKSNCFILRYNVRSEIPNSLAANFLFPLFRSKDFLMSSILFHE